MLGRLLATRSSPIVLYRDVGRESSHFWPPYFILNEVSFLFSNFLCLCREENRVEIKTMKLIFGSVTWK